MSHTEPDRDTGARDTGARDTGARDTGARDTRAHDTSEVRSTDRHAVLDREKEEHGGVKIGSAFFGFLTATGMVVLLTALVSAAGTAVALTTGTDVDEMTAQATDAASTVGIVGGVIIALILFASYFSGGYVAGRMARFNGMVQGVAVWVWAVVVAIVVAILGAVAGADYNILANLDIFPRIPLEEGDLATGGIIAAIVAIVVSLLGAVIGGMAGMRFHRRVDRTGLGR